MAGIDRELACLEAIRLRIVRIVQPVRVAAAHAKFVRMVQRHMKRKEKYPDEGPGLGMPYEGIDNLRPESKAAVQEFLFMMKSPEM